MVAYSAPSQKTTSRIPACFESAVAITTADATQQGPYAAIYVGGAGDVKVVPRNDDGTHPVIFKAVPVGTILYINVQGVEATGTTATNLVGLN